MEATQNSSTNNNMEENVFDRSFNSKVSDWTSVFDSNVELGPYKFCWSRNGSSGPSSPNLKCSRDSLLSESVVFEKVVKAKEQLLKLFDEGCGSIYQDIQDSFENWNCGQEVYFNDLLEKEALVRAHAEQLADLAPEMTELIGLKLASLSRSLEQLRLKHEADVKLNQTDYSASSALRKWLQKTEFTLEQIKENVSLAIHDLSELQRQRATLQVVQLEIETDGRQLLQIAKRYFTKKAAEWTDSNRVQRLKRNLEVLETRWYTSYLACVEAIQQINNFVDHSSNIDEGSDIESVSSSEPLRKRRRHSLNEGSFGAFKSLNSGGLQAESEEDEDTIPFGASEYESIMPGDSQSSDVEYENDRGRLVANRSAMVSSDDSALDKAPGGLEHRISSAEDGWSSSGKTHDVGYSSGENSVHEALNSIGSELPANNQTTGTQTETGELQGLQEIQQMTSLVNSYYRTVPLDDCGITDTEAPRFVPVLSLNLAEDSDNGNQLLSESMVVQTSDNSDDNHNPEKDYKEVMKIMDEHLASTSSMKMGTSWKELKSVNNRRLSSTPNKWSSVGRMSNRRSLPTANRKTSCDASSEDSDTAGTKLPTQLSISFNGRPSNLLTVPQAGAHSQSLMTQRKRRYQRQTPTTKMTNSLNNSILKNLAMDQSVYEPAICNEENRDDLMSQSLNLSNMNEKAGRKRLARRRMRRTASDNTDLGLCVSNLTTQAGLTELKTLERRNSMESNSSSTTTFHDSGDVHFEWDEYKEDPLIEDATITSNTVDMNGLSQSKHSISIMPILATPDVDEDFHNELPFIDINDNMGVNSFLSQSRESLDESYRLLQSQQGNESALRLNAKSVGRIANDNLRRIRAIMRSSANLDMHSLEEFEKLHAAWLELIGKHQIPADDTLSAKEVSEVLALMRKIREYYILFGETCEQPDSEFADSATVDEIKNRLNMRKESFLELQKLHEKMAKIVRQFSELQPDLDRVSANINVLSRSVTNLECLYQIGGLRESLKDLYQRLDEVTIVVSRLSNGKKTGPIQDHKIESQLRRIEMELTDCQNRMFSLETVCNNIIAWLNKNSNDMNIGVDEDEVVCMKKILQQFEETRDEVAEMRSRFDTLLKYHCPDLLGRPNSQLNEDSYSDSSVSKYSTSGLKPRRRRHSSVVDLQTTSTSNGKTVARDNHRFNSSTSQPSTSFHQNPTLRTLFSCMVLIGFGLFILYLTADDEIFTRSGHWRFKFGPQLRYVNGPPPF